LEHGYDQGMATRELLTNRGFEKVGTRRDLGGNERVSWGQLPSREAD
jgi:release factor glutamine methyltransferase